tara:strand:- start:886 stop:1059 length:174 start_codon:yes stop_codon:yes gene_type:complete
MESLEDRFLTPSLRSERKEKNVEEPDIGDKIMYGKPKKRKTPIKPKRRTARRTTRRK